MILNICEHCKCKFDHEFRLFNNESSRLINGGHCFNRRRHLMTCFEKFILNHNQPERSKREDSICCKEREKIERLREVIIESNHIDCGEWYNDYSDIVDIFNGLCEQAEMRCSEHGTKVREG